MKSLENFVNEYNQTQINEYSSNQPSLIDYDASDSGIMKLIKGFLRWASGSTEEKTYNPADKEYDTHKTGAALKEWQKTTGKKTTEIEVKELKDTEMKQIVSKLKLPYLKKDMEENQKLYKDNVYRQIILKDVDRVCKKLPVAFYSFNKSLYKGKYMYITNIEVIQPYNNVIDTVDVMGAIKKDMKSIDAKSLIVRFSDPDCYEDFLDDIDNANNFERNKGLEKKDKERIYVFTAKAEKKKKTEETADEDEEEN